MKMIRFFIPCGAGTAALLLALAACAQLAPVPGGTDSVNPSFYSAKEDFLARLGTLQPGMSEADVMAHLGRKEEELIRLKRDEVMIALLGTSNVEIRDGAQETAADGSQLQSIYGYRLNYRVVERHHGFSSPIRVRTDESGFDYAVTLLFRDGKLAERPIITGGEINASSSKTFFDFLNPGTAVNRIGR